ncbi:UNVERIFIED_CONTAM: hypothetical protein PYX00_006125 [Menopon gallinae]|uniref:Uncharacterized protein n=1 Tax=Menopon gallinae TaxID=328185 RepID=A0AAW2HTX3_9NEOP
MHRKSIRPEDGLPLERIVDPLDFIYVIIVAAATLSHLFNWCVIGACDAVFSGLEANIGSTTYLIGMSLMTANYVRFPAFLERPSRPVLYAYYVLLSFFASSVALRLVWVPLTDTMAEMNLFLAKAITFSTKVLRLGRKTPLRRLAAFLETKTALSWVANSIGISFLYWVCDSLNFQKSIKLILRQTPGIKRIFGQDSRLTWTAIIKRQAMNRASTGSPVVRKDCKKCSFLDVIGPETDYGDEEED